MEDRLKFKKGDIAAAAVVVVFALLVFFLFLPKDASGETVLIYKDGELIKTLSLDTDCSYTVSGEYENTVEIKNGSAAVIHSDCPGADCVHTGPINRPGRSIVCLPNRVEIVISGGSDVDFVLG